MSDPVFREYTSSDIPALTSLWMEIFSDSEGTISAFFKVLPDIGTCFVAESSGEIIGMTSVLTDLQFKDGLHCVKCGYIYAVAVDIRFRGAGIGGTLSRMAAEYAREHGAEIIATLPAEEGLYLMYARTIGLEYTLMREKITALSEDADGTPFPFAPADPADYNRKREELLSSVPHISVSDESIRFLKVLCRENGGDIFISDKCCASCYVNQNEVFFTELLCPDEEIKNLLAGGAAHHDLDTAYCYIPSQSGKKSLAYKGGTLPNGTVWNTCFE